MELNKEVKVDDFINQFNWQKNAKVVAYKLKSILKEDESILISKFSLEEEDNDYYISMLISFKNTDNNTYINSVKFNCYINKDNYKSYEVLYTANDKNAACYGEHPISLLTITKEVREGWNNVDDIVRFLADNIINNIDYLKCCYKYENPVVKYEAVNE